MPEKRQLKPRSKTTQIGYSERVKGEAKYPETTNAHNLRLYLEARRKRVGYTEEDLRQAPYFMK